MLCRAYCFSKTRSRKSKAIKRHILDILSACGIDINSKIGLSVANCAEEVISASNSFYVGERSKVVSLFFAGLCEQIKDLNQDQKTFIQNNPDHVFNAPAVTRIHNGRTYCAQLESPQLELIE